MTTTVERCAAECSGLDWRPSIDGRPGAACVLDGGEVVSVYDADDGGSGYVAWMRPMSDPAVSTARHDTPREALAALRRALFARATEMRRRARTYDAADSRIGYALAPPARAGKDEP